jgi:hypothetical protein
VHIGRRQVDHYLFSGDVEAPGLQGRYGPQETFLDGGIGQTDQVKAYAELDFYLDRHGHRLDAHALGSMDVDQHILILF